MSATGGSDQQGGGGDDDDADDPDDVGLEKWEVKIRKLSLTRVLAGDKMGREARRLREYLEAVEGDEEFKHHLRHLNKFTAAEALNTSKKIACLPVEELQVYAKDLRGYHVEFPTQASGSHLEELGVVA